MNYNANEPLGGGIQAIVDERDKALKMIRDQAEKFDRAIQTVKAIALQQKRRIQFLEECNGELHAKISPQHWDMAQIIKGLTADLNRANEVNAVLQEGHGNQKAELIDLRHQLDALKADYERIDAVNRDLKAENAGLRDALNFLQDV